MEEEPPPTTPVKKKNKNPLQSFESMMVQEWSTKPNLRLRHHTLEGKSYECYCEIVQFYNFLYVCVTARNIEWKCAFPLLSCDSCIRSDNVGHHKQRLQWKS